jgi:hypothetical protein
MFCQNCGAFDTEEASFCYRCGESLSEVPKNARLAHLRIWERVPFVQGVNLFRAFLDSSFQPYSLKRIRVLYRLSVLSIVLSAVLFIVLGFESSERFGLISLLMIVILAFLFVAMCSRIIFELGPINSRAGNPSLPGPDNPESKDQIEWNIKNDSGFPASLCQDEEGNYRYH